MLRPPLLRVLNLSKSFQIGNGALSRKGLIHTALKDVCLDIVAGECLAVVGESGSGKTTLGRCILRLIRADKGQVVHQGKDLLQLTDKEFRPFRRDFQMIFQNSAQALNPRLSVAACLKEPLRVCSGYRKEALSKRLLELLGLVGLKAELINRFPHELSGGERQRLAIARALTTNPSLLIADEPTSSLDASLKRLIVELLNDLRSRLGLTLVLISHDLPLVAAISDRVAVMYAGTIIELASTHSLVRMPSHPYTKMLMLSSSYQYENDSTVSDLYEVQAYSSNTKPKGCVFANRCPQAEDTCLTEVPLLKQTSDGHFVACHLAGEFAATSELQSHQIAVDETRARH